MDGMDFLTLDEINQIRQLIRKGSFKAPSESYIRLNRNSDLPTWGANLHGQLRYNPDTARLALATSLAWEDVATSEDIDVLTESVLNLPVDLVLENTLEASGGNPSASVGAAAGSGGSVGVAVEFGNDIAGRVTVTAGTSSLTTGVLCSVSFASARPDTNYTVQLTPGSSEAAVLGYYATGRTTAKFDIAVTTAPGSGETLTFAFLVIEDA